MIWEKENVEHDKEDWDVGIDGIFIFPSTVYYENLKNTEKLKEGNSEHPYVPNLDSIIINMLLYLFSFVTYLSIYSFISLLIYEAFKGKNSLPLKLQRAYH